MNFSTLERINQWESESFLCEIMIQILCRILLADEEGCYHHGILFLRQGFQQSFLERFLSR